MPAIRLPPPSELPHEGGQILEVPIIARKILDKNTYSLTVEFKEMSVFGQTLKLEFHLPPPPPFLSVLSSLAPYIEEKGSQFVLRVQVTVLGALAYHAFDAPEFALFYMKVLYPALPPGYPDPCEFVNKQYHEENQPNPFPHFSFLPPLPCLLAGGADLD